MSVTAEVAGLTAKKAAAKKKKKKKAEKKADPYRPGRYVATPVLSGHDRLIASRFSYGITPALAVEVTRAGGGLAWFDAQLRSAYDSKHDVAKWWPGAVEKPSSKVVRTGDTDELASGYSAWVLQRRIVSPRPVLERVTEVLENHLHVPSRPGPQVRYRAEYGRLIRSMALGKFADLLIAATQHPAMQIYLTNSGSTKEHPNENLGRELLELHTVGVGNYTEDDVKNSAKILTGYVVDTSANTAPTYLPSNHWIGPVTVMPTRAGWPAPFSHPNADPDGRRVTAAYLGYLARHPATARRIVHRLATAFVSDNPSAALVSDLTRVYLANDTAIRPVLLRLIRSSEFARSAGAKLRDPASDMVATHRVLGTTFHPPQGWESAANQIFRQLDVIGGGPMTWASPNGAPNIGAPWASPVRAVTSADFHYLAAGRWFPSSKVTYRAPQAFFPKKKLEFRLWVDHLSRTLLGRPSDAQLLKACCTATGHRPKTVLKRSAGSVEMQFADLAIAMLDHPWHYHY